MSTTVLQSSARHYYGLPTDLTYPDGALVHVDRDPLGRAATLSVGGVGLWSQGYTGLRRGAGSSGALDLSRSYNPEGLPERVAAAVGPSTRFELSRSYSNANRFVSQQKLGAIDEIASLGHDEARRASTWRSDRSGAGAAGAALGWGVAANERADRSYVNESLDDLQTNSYFFDGEQLVTTFDTAPISHRLQSAGGWSFGYDERGNRSTASTGIMDRTFRHDWSNRLLEALSGPAGAESSDAVFRFDPLGRRISTTENGVTTLRVPWGEQVVAEYLEEIDGSLTLRRRSYWGDAVDDLLAYDWDRDLSGSFERYHPLTDAQGTVQAIADVNGAVVESYLYRPDGNFLIFASDTTAPRLLLARIRPADAAAGRITQIAELVFSEATQPGGGTVELQNATGDTLFDNNDWQLSDDRTTWTVSIDPALTEGDGYRLIVENVEDLAGNTLATSVDEPFTAPAEDDALVLPIGGAGEVLAVIDGPGQLAFVSGVPIDPASLASSSVTMRRLGIEVPGSLSLHESDDDYEARIVLWTPDVPEDYLKAAHEIQHDLNLEDPAGHPIAPPTEQPIAYHHRGQGDVIWSRPTEAPLLSASQVGNDRFLHGRPYIDSIGMYDHRARFYEPATQLFLQADPLGPIDSPNLYQGFGFDSFNVVDPFGKNNSRYRSAYARGGIEAVNELPEVKRAREDAEWCRSNPEECAAERAAENARLFGVLMMGGAVAEGAGGLAICAASVGWVCAGSAVLLVHSADTWQTGMAMYHSGVPQETQTFRLFEAGYGTLLSPEKAKVAARYTEIAGISAVGAGMARGAMSFSARTPSMAFATEAAMEAAAQTTSRGFSLFGRRGVARWTLQRLTTKANAQLADDPALAQQVLSRREYAAGQRNPRVAPMQYGNAEERLVKQAIEESPIWDRFFEHVGGPSNPDFVGRGVFKGFNFDITTPGQVEAHLARPGYGNGLIITTYERQQSFRLFPEASTSGAQP